MQFVSKEEGEERDSSAQIGTIKEGEQLVNDSAAVLMKAESTATAFMSRCHEPSSQTNGNLNSTGMNSGDGNEAHAKEKPLEVEMVGRNPSLVGSSGNVHLAFEGTSSHTVPALSRLDAGSVHETAVPSSAALDMADGENTTCRMHADSAAHCDILPAASGTDRPATQSGSANYNVNRSVLGVKESCYASSLFVSSRLPTMDGNQCLPGVGITGVASAFCTVPTAGAPATPLSYYSADLSALRCGQAAAEAASRSAPTTCAGEAPLGGADVGHQCPKCGRELSTRGNLNKHLRSVHGSLLPERA
jgi:predicted RNA-binding Zn-ribbon protein involved in translation (DUF1610 family)